MLSSYPATVRCKHAVGVLPADGHGADGELGRTLIQRSQGGAGGGKSRLTEDAKQLLAQYEAYSAALRGEAARLYDRYFEGLF